MGMIVVTGDHRFTDSIPLFAYADIALKQCSSVAQALVLADEHPGDLIIIDTDTVTAGLQVLTGRRVISVGACELGGLESIHHFVPDQQGNFWVAVQLLAAEQSGRSHADPVSSAALLTRPEMLSLAEKASSGIIAVDVAGVVRDATDKFLQSVSQPVDRVLGKSLADLLGDGPLQELQKFISSAEPGSLQTFEFRQQEAAGWVSWLVLGHRVTISGTPVLVAVVRNISDRERAGRALTREIEKSRRLLDTLPDGVVVLDRNLAVVECNDAFAELHGYSRDELIGTSGLNLVTMEEAESRSRALAGLSATSKIVNDRVAVRKDGTQINVEVHSVVVGEGAQRQYISVVRDLRPFQDAQRRLRESEDRYQTIFSNIPGGICITTRSGEFLEVNQAFCDLVGLSREQLFEKQHSFVAGGDGRLQQFYDRVVANGSDHADVDVTLHDGRLVQLEAFGTLLASQSLEEPEQVMIMHIDQTARAMAEKTSRHLADKLAKLITTLPMAAIELDQQRRITAWNPTAEKLFGYHAEQAQMLTLDQITPPDRQARVKRVWGELLEQPASRYYLGQGLNRSGEVIECEWYITPIINESGALVSLICLAVDITAKKQLELQASQTQKMEALGQLAGGIAHDFNNILTGIIGYGDLAAIHPGVAEDTKLKGYLDAIHRAGNRGRDLIRQMLNYTRMRPPRVELIEPEKTVGEVVQMLEATLPKSIRIQSLFDRQLPAIRVDSTQLHQVVMNLCVNAKDALPDQKGTLTIKLKQRNLQRTSCHSCQQLFHGEYLMLSIEDDGVGMSVELISKIFDPFFTTKEVGKGTGMGLAATDGIVHGAGGHVRVRSREGKGTRFEIFLPCTDQPTPELKKVEVDPGSGGEGLRLLLVDDDQQVLDFQQELFSGQGYQVIACSSPREALTVVDNQTERFDAVITDFIMPEMNGAELARELQQRQPDTPVLLCTGYLDEEDRLTGMPPNVKQLLYKPLSAQQMIATVGITIQDNIGIN